MQLPYLMNRMEPAILALMPPSKNERERKAQR
jgi:hypothetical protein